MKRKYSIVLEGPTSAGKTTYAKYLVRRLQEDGVDVKYVKLSPSQNIIGNLIRNLRSINLPYLVEDLLYLTDNFVEYIRNNFSNNEIIVYDKSPFNLLAFWKIFRSDTYVSKLERLVSLLYSDFQPDMVFYLDAEYEEREERTKRKNPRSRMDEFLIQPQIDERLERYLYQYIKTYFKKIRYIDTTGKEIEDIGNYILNEMIRVINGGNK